MSQHQIQHCKVADKHKQSPFLATKYAKQKLRALRAIVMNITEIHSAEYQSITDPYISI